jgi:hypothetical protein
MQTNRISPRFWEESASVAVAAPEGFVICQGCMGNMVAATGWTLQQEVFRMAYEVARANREAMTRAVAYHDYHHRFFSNWN